MNLLRWYDSRKCFLRPNNQKHIVDENTMLVIIINWLTKRPRRFVKECLLVVFLTMVCLWGRRFFYIFDDVKGQLFLSTFWIWGNIDDKLRRIICWSSGNASELLENLEEMFPLCYKHRDMLSMSQYPIT